MTEREHVKDEKLIYTCNCGWIDLGHINDTSEREFVGPKNLWKQICNGDSTPEAQARWQTRWWCPAPRRRALSTLFGPQTPGYPLSLPTGHRDSRSPIDRTWVRARNT